MAKQKWLEEIVDGINDLETGDLRDKLPHTRVHRLTLRRSELINGFKNAATIRANKNGQKIDSINTNKNWSEAIARAWDNMKTSGRSLKQLERGGLPGTIKGLNALPKFKGLYIEEESVDKYVLVAFPMDQTGTGASSVISTKTAGGNPKDGFDSAFRKRVWREFVDEHDAGGSGGALDTGTKSGYEEAIGSELPSSHKTTLGQESLTAFFDGLRDDVNQDLEEGFFGKWVDNTTYTDLHQKVMNSIKASWTQEEWPNLSETEGKDKYVRVIDVEVLERVKNYGNADDLQHLKPKIQKVITDHLSTIKPMNTLNKEQMIEFEGSPSIKKTSAANAARLLTKKLKKGAKGSKAVKVTKTSPKPQKKKRGGVARRPKSYSGKVTAGSKIAIASRVSSSTKRKVVDDVLKLTRVIQKRLPAEVRRNMGRPALINRTGRFSNSVRLINLAQTSKGVAGTYTYRLNPYATFENLGEKQWPVGYNPKSLITKSIRSLAVQYTKQRLTRLRRT